MIVVVVVVLVCGDTGCGPALVPEVSAAGGPAFVVAEGMLVVPVFPAWSGDFDAVCRWIVTFTVVSSVPPLLPWLVLVVMMMGCVMDCCPGVEASVETFVILVVPTLPGNLTGASVPEVLLGTGAIGVCSVAALEDATEPPLLSAVAAGVGVFDGLGVATAEVASILTVGRGLEVTVGGAGVFFVTVGACGWVGAGLSVGLGVIVIVICLGSGVVIAAVVFAGVGVCVGSFFLLASSVGGATVVPPTVAFLSVVGSVLDELPPVGTADGPGVAEAVFFVTEGAV